MTRRRRDTLRRRPFLRRGARPGEDREAGQAGPELIAVTTAVVVVVAVLIASATPVGAQVRDELLCGISTVGGGEAAEQCVDHLGGGSGDEEGSGGEDDGGPAGDEPGGDDGEFPDDGYSPPTGDCEDDVTFEKVDNEGPYDTPVVQIGCVWYPIKACGITELPDGWFERDAADRVYPEEEIGKFVDCVTDGYGPPGDDPNDENCSNTLPTSGEIDEDAPPRVQVGCRELPVPRGCEAQWGAYRDAAVGRERAGRAAELSNCIAETYGDIEPECVVSSESHVDSENVSFLFVRWGSSNGMLIERLGDGRIRVHVLRGVEQGAGVTVNSSISFDVAGVTGYETDKTYEFTDMGKAQEWIDWYKKYNDVNGVTEGAGCQGSGLHWGAQCREVPEATELQDEEPEHHELAEGESESRTVSFTGGLSASGDVGPVELEGSIEGGYEGEVSVDETVYADGATTVAYTSKDVGGFLIGASLSGSAPFTRNSQDEREHRCRDQEGESRCDGSGAGSGQVGMEWTGTTQIEVNRHPDGSLYNVILRIDDQVLRTLAKAGIDVEASLPRAFSVGGGWERTEQNGTASVREMIIDFNQYPELRDELGPKIDELFPRDEDGRLKRDDIEIDASDYTDGGSFSEAIEDQANVRELEYDVDVTTEGGHGGVDLMGVNLFEAEWTTVDETRELDSSSYDVIDVNGDRQTVSPAPACRAEKFEEDPGYYADDFSDPPTRNQDSEHDFGAEYFDNDSPMYTEDGPYPGTAFDGDVPDDRDDLVHSLLDEYSAAFPDDNILVVKDFDNFSFSFVEGFEHLATVDGMDVIAIDKGTVENNGDGGWINWGFKGNYDRTDDKTVEFEPQPKGECTPEADPEESPSVPGVFSSTAEPPPLVVAAAVRGPRNGHCGGEE